MDTEIRIDADGSLLLVEIDDNGDYICILEQYGPTDNYEVQT